MKTSLTMQQLVCQLAECYAVDLSQVGVYLRLGMPKHDFLVMDHIGRLQIAVAQCFTECSAWKIDRKVVFFTDYINWVPIAITQLTTGWTAYAKLDINIERKTPIRICALLLIIPLVGCPLICCTRLKLGKALGRRLDCLPRSMMWNWVTSLNTGLDSLWNKAL